MELECSQNKLIKGLLLAERLTAKNNNLPILQTILLEVVNNKLIIQATNLEVGYKNTLNIKSIKNGKVAVDAKIITSLINNLPDNELIKIKEVNNNLVITSIKNESTIKTHQVDDFPIIPKPEGGEFIINPNNFINGLKSVIYAGSVSNIKPEIASVYIYHQGGDYVFVSTDSFRLAEKKYQEQIEGDFNPIIIPLKNCSEIIKVFEGVDSPITITSNPNQLSLESDGIYLTSQLINGVYPDYNQIMPNSFTTKVTVNKTELLLSLKTINIFSDKFNQINMNFIENELVVNSKNQDSGESSSKVKIDTSGDRLDVSLNARYLIEGLQNINNEKIFIGLNGKNKAILIKGVGDGSFRYLMMPVVR